MSDWHELCITDSTGQQFFRCTASPMATYSEIKNLKRHIEQAKKRPDLYKNLFEIDSAVILLDGTPYGEPAEIDVDAMVDELEAMLKELEK